MRSSKSKTVAITYAYDRLGRLTSAGRPDMDSTFVYDGAINGIGRLHYMQTSTGNRRTHTYDSAGRPTGTILRVDGIDYAYAMSYNADGRLAIVQYPSGFTARYEYTAAQRHLEYLRDHSNGGSLWRANTRNALGQYTQATMANGVTINRTFDAQTGRLRDVEAGSDNAVADFDYTWDALGNLDTRNDDNLNLFEDFTYNTANRLTQADVTSPGYSATHQAGYTATGNIAGKSRLGSPGTGNFYDYPAAGQARPYGVTAITGVVNGQTNPTFAYDANGNMTDGAGREYTWEGNRDGGK